ncbi:hypothetical protein B0J11DRAFT_536821 [Dendryphion nanum]|uniref:Phospholipid/glycerol acyltransferase domain-containing protein n=1 Tax=Dendryphion nanum TaxID=256645 RepID=A0A9P9DER5_9PLEO|nr:hypothetical protein B0J11DRAFT_536821 [Dendryphion nanum]
MEKYSQFRDKGTSIAPFFPTSPPQDAIWWLFVKIPLFFIRLPAAFLLSIFPFLILEFIPLGSSIQNGVIMILLGICGVWWVDLQVDGVKRGSLAKSQDHLPSKGTVVASSFTSPLDPLYLAGIFHPVFTRSYPDTRKVEHISLFKAILLAFSSPTLIPPNSAKLVTLRELKEKYPESIICVFPECTTTNGRAILKLSPSLLSADERTKIFPVSVKYAPGDITTPVSGNRIQWMWRLLSRPTHTIRVRIAGPVFVSRQPKDSIESDMGFDTNIFDSPHMRNRAGENGADGEDNVDVTSDEQKVLDRVAEDLARMGRVKRVTLGAEQKQEFLKVWSKRRTR